MPHTDKHVLEALPAEVTPEADDGGALARVVATFLHLRPCSANCRESWTKIAALILKCDLGEALAFWILVSSADNQLSCIHTEHHSVQREVAVLWDLICMKLPEVLVDHLLAIGVNAALQQGSVSDRICSVTRAFTPK